jgi:hypothetical protein
MRMRTINYVIVVYKDKQSQRQKANSFVKGLIFYLQGQWSVLYRKPQRKAKKHGNPFVKSTLPYGVDGVFCGWGRDPWRGRALA